MCAGAAINARISNVIFGAYDEKARSCGSLVNLFQLPITIGQRFGAAFFKKNVRLSSPNFLCGSALFLKRRHDRYRQDAAQAGRHLVQSEGSFLFALIQVL